jgi:tight adherence protein B
MSAASAESWVPLLVLVFVAVSLLLHGAWLIWDQTVRKSRGLSMRWQRFHPRAGSAADATRAGRNGPGAARARGGAWRARAVSLDWLDRPLRDANIRWRASQVLIVVMATGAALAAVALLLGLPAALVLPAWLVLGAIPWIHAARITRRRVAQIQEQLGDAVDLIARALRAGHALASALRMVADQAPAPISQEFATVCEQIGFGVPADEALREMATRSRSEDLRYFVIAVLLQRETGGNLAELLDNIAALVRQRQQLRQSVRALSAEGRLSAWILSILPFALAGAIAVINPELLSLLWTDPAGRAMSASALLMMVTGILVMRRLIRVRA